VFVCVQTVPESSLRVDRLVELGQVARTRKESRHSAAKRAMARTSATYNRSGHPLTGTYNGSPP
jgi:hypothetical protein